MKFSNVVAAGLLAAAISTSASAATFYDRVDAPGVGRWLVTYQFDQAGSLTVEPWEMFNANVYDASGDYVFGYDNDIDLAHKVFTNTDSISFVLRVNNPGNWYGWGGGQVERYEYYAWANTYGEFTNPVKWSVTTDYLGAVPEPATWAMMIIGFGAVGSTVRKRRRDGLSPA